MNGQTKWLSIFKCTRRNKGWIWIDTITKTKSQGFLLIHDSNKIKDYFVAVEEMSNDLTVYKKSRHCLSNVYILSGKM